MVFCEICISNKTGVIQSFFATQVYNIPLWYSIFQLFIRYTKLPCVLFIVLESPCYYIHIQGYNLCHYGIVSTFLNQEAPIKSSKLWSKMENSSGVLRVVSRISLTLIKYKGTGRVMVHSDFIAVHRSTSADPSLSQQLCALRIFVHASEVVTQ